MAAGEATGLILRFRDLATGSGQTVELHNEISAKHGYVWWGWWRRPREKVPEDVFRNMVRQAQAGATRAYLYDSGRNLVFTVALLEIKWSPLLDDIPSPEPALTPAYYRGEKYQAWSKLGKITPVPSESLEALTYVRVDDFFENGTSPWESFYGKQVSSGEELQQQARTIWFTRAFEKGDGTKEISLLDSTRIEPADFPPRFLASRSTRLLWLSDTHFSTNREHHGFPIEATAAEGPLAPRLESALNGDTSLGGVLVTGDLTWRAEPSEFELARVFLLDVGKWAHVGYSQVAILPGNHDLAFSNDPAEKGSKVTATSSKAREAFERFYEMLFFQRPNAYLISGRRYLLGEAVPVELVALNSSTLQQAKGHFQGHGFLGQEQLDEAAKQMGWTRADGPRAWRIVALHHHVLPVTYREIPIHDQPYSVVLDAEAFMRWVAVHKVDIVLHGHMHQPASVRITHPVNPSHPDQGTWTFSILAMGSTGAASDHLGETPVNTFGLLDFTLDYVELAVQSIHPTNPPQQLWGVSLPRGSDGG